MLKNLIYTRSRPLYVKIPFSQLRQRNLVKSSVQTKGKFKQEKILLRISELF